MINKILKVLILLLKWIAKNVKEDDPALYEECVELIGKVDEAVEQNERPD